MGVNAGGHNLGGVAGRAGETCRMSLSWRWVALINRTISVRVRAFFRLSFERVPEKHGESETEFFRETCVITSNAQTNALNTIASTAADTETEQFLGILQDQERIRGARVPNVSRVLVVLSSHGMVYDIESLRQKIVLTYPDAAVFFRTTSGKAIGRECPQQVELLIDLTGPRQRQGWFYSKKLRRMARFAVGRNAGLFRKGIYDRVFDEKDAATASRLPKDLLEKERFVQRRVLELAGVALAQQGDALPDLGGSIALELPAMTRA